MKKIYMNELAKILNINESALRYYDSKELLPNIQRDSNNYRFIFEQDIERANTVICLKKTGMPLNEIKKYLDLLEQGNSSLEIRYKMILKQEKMVLEKIEDIKKQVEFINFKKDIYEKKIEEEKYEN
ncbi:MerR family transcriptional regulator [Spiroplasma monobiae]|uniref:MerR family transcriptional regulator n=1 Tax=Spiroplasma monobiae MQ-1 TaxID=1336748 RepID=A0A2K9LT86_SPISQ|nr:MerR family transcriptional regulator [Spiroplasma monobiae]AUM62292.1 MerR family transcriptional regulator [Spiroplasma monobiae MQ-1]